MNKQFRQFLTNKHTAKNPNKCDHSKDYWCDKCIAKPQLTSVEMPDGTISTGYVITNF